MRPSAQLSRAPQEDRLQASQEPWGRQQPGGHQDREACVLQALRPQAEVTEWGGEGSKCAAGRSGVGGASSPSLLCQG